MKVKREELLQSLQFARLGLSNRGETLEQSNSYVFKDGKLVTFNDEILSRCTSPLGDLQAAVLAEEFLTLVEKLPDEELEVELKGKEMVLVGTRRSAGITAFIEIQLPFDAVPAPEKWYKLGEKTFGMLQQAARICSRDATMELTTVVHATPKLVESCDNFRLFRATIETGFPEEVLIPAESLLELEPWKVVSVSVGKGWVHFRTEDKTHVVSIRCSHEKYHGNLDVLLTLGKDAETVSLPGNLVEIVERSSVMLDAENPAVQLKMEAGKLTLISRKDTGWYKETKKVKYEGKPLDFEVNAKFLVEVFGRSKDVQVDSKRLKLVTDEIEFVSALKRD